MKKATDVLADAGYAESQIKDGMEYADQHEWKDEDERGAYALAKILYSESDLEYCPKAPWALTC